MASIVKPAFLVCIAFATPAAAEPACEPVIRAMLRVSDEPGVHQRTLAGPAGKETMLMEAISLKDAMYVREGPQGKWRRTPFDAARRRQLAESALKMLPPSDCPAPRDHIDGTVPVSVHEFSQPDPLKPGSKTRTAIWIGKADGLPRRLLLGDGSYQTMEYGTFPAPGP